MNARTAQLLTLMRVAKRLFSIFVSDVVSTNCACLIEWHSERYFERPLPTELVRQRARTAGYRDCACKTVNKGGERETLQRTDRQRESEAGRSGGSEAAALVAPCPLHKRAAPRQSGSAPYIAVPARSATRVHVRRAGARERLLTER
jgi:general stress protein YciG